MDKRLCRDNTQVSIAPNECMSAGREGREGVRATTAGGKEDARDKQEPSFKPPPERKEKGFEKNLAVMLSTQHWDSYVWPCFSNLAGAEGDLVGDFTLGALGH